MSILKQNRDFIRKIRIHIKDGFMRDEESLASYNYQISFASKFYSPFGQEN